jgi:hypothetical protein
MQFVGVPSSAIRLALWLVSLSAAAGIYHQNRLKKSGGAFYL